MSIVHIAFLDVWRVYFDICTSRKKVLLRERKRHTARRVSSTPSAALSGYLPRPEVPTLTGGYQPWLGGTYPGWGYPISGHGAIPSWVPHLVLVRYPPGVNRQMPVKTVPSPILQMRAVIKQHIKVRSHLTTTMLRLVYQTSLSDFTSFILLDTRCSF